MNSELKARVERADAKLARQKDNMNIASVVLNKNIEKFGIYRQVVLKNTVGRFKEDLEFLGKKGKVKGGNFSIPYEIEMSKLSEVTLNDVNFTSEQKWKITDRVLKATNSGINKLNEVIAKRKGPSYKPSSNTTTGGSGTWWLDLLIAGAEIFSAVQEKKEAERTEVQRYEAETETLCKQIDARIAFLHQISNRITEIITVSDALEARCIEALEKLEKIIDVIDFEVQSHLRYFETARILVEGMRKLSQTEILDAKNQLSLSDKQYIIKTRQLLAETL